MDVEEHVGEQQSSGLCPASREAGRAPRRRQCGVCCVYPSAVSFQQHQVGVLAGLDRALDAHAAEHSEFAGQVMRRIGARVPAPRFQSPLPFATLFDSTVSTIIRSMSGFERSRPRTTTAVGPASCQSVRARSADTTLNRRSRQTASSDCITFHNARGDRFSLQLTLFWSIFTRQELS